MITRPKKPLSNDIYKDVPEGWVDSLSDKELSLCSASILLAVRGRDRGARMMKLYILGKALRIHLELKDKKPGPYLPRKWFRKAMRPLFPYHFNQAWEDAVHTGLITDLPEVNAIHLVSSKSEDFWPKTFSLLGMDPEVAAKNKGGFDDIVWTTHTVIAPRFKDVIGSDWSDQKIKACLAAVFMWGINQNGIFPNLTTFGNLFGVCSKTVERWSKESGEFSQRRCILVPGTPWVPDWNKDELPPQLQGVGKPVMNAKSPQFKLTKKLLDRTRKWGENGHKTHYFVYRGSRRKESRLARRIPNHHKPVRGRKIKTAIPDSASWCTARKRVSPEQLFNKPDEGMRVWYNDAQFDKLVKENYKDRRWDHYEKLSPEEKARFRDDVKISRLPNFKDKGDWVQERELKNLRVQTRATLEQLRMELRKLSGSPKPMFTPEAKGEFIKDQPEEKRERWVARIAEMERVKVEAWEEKKRVLKKKIRDLEPLVDHYELIWKRTCLLGSNGEDRFGINRFTTTIVPLWGNLLRELQKLMPGREFRQWQRVYGLGHRKFKAKKKSIRCTACRHVISHLPHPQYHTGCPHCGGNFATGVAGLAL